jgi:hypothetical protein
LISPLPLHQVEKGVFFSAIGFTRNAYHQSNKGFGYEEIAKRLYSD